MFLKRTFIMLFSLFILSLAANAMAVDPEIQPDDSWLTVNGTVQSVDRDSFILDYGEGVITVEMDDGDRDADAYKLLPGDNVRVTGIVDDDLYERRTIEASSVYVEKLNTYFYASSMDEEGPVRTAPSPVTFSQTILQGTVTAIVDNEEFMIDTGAREVLVETDALPYDPLDDVGYQTVDVGDTVSVTGRMDDDLFEGREFVAHSLVTLDQ